MPLITPIYFYIIGMVVFSSNKKMGRTFSEAKLRERKGYILVQILYKIYNLFYIKYFYITFK